MVKRVFRCNVIIMCKIKTLWYTKVLRQGNESYDRVDESYGKREGKDHSNRKSTAEEENSGRDRGVHLNQRNMKCRSVMRHVRVGYFRKLRHVRTLGVI